jgi:hypothetical protein
MPAADTREQAKVKRVPIVEKRCTVQGSRRKVQDGQHVKFIGLIGWAAVLNNCLNYCLDEVDRSP